MLLTEMKSSRAQATEYVFQNTGIIFALTLTSLVIFVLVSHIGELIT